MANNPTPGNIALNQEKDDTDSDAEFFDDIDWDAKSEDLPEQDLSDMTIPEPTLYNRLWKSDTAVNNDTQGQEAVTKSDNVMNDDMYSLSHQQRAMNPSLQALVAEKAAIRNEGVKPKQEHDFQAQNSTKPTKSDRNQNEALRQSPPTVSPSKKRRISITKHDISQDVILCGREFANSSHPGNLAYLQMIADNKARHHELGPQYGEKTRIRNEIVTDLMERGCRFARKARGETYYLLTLQEVQAKVSQSLREN